MMGRYGQEMNPERASNFSFLKAHDAQLVRLGLLAERYFADDPNTCLLKLRQLSELLAQLAASRVGIFTSSQEKQLDLLRRLQDHGIVPREVGALFHEVRKAGKTMTATLAGEPVTKKDATGKEYKEVQISDIKIG